MGRPLGIARDCMCLTVDPSPLGIEALLQPYLETGWEIASATMGGYDDTGVHRSIGVMTIILQRDKELG